MKTIVRKDGQKFIVTNALYEEVKRKGLLEDLFDGKLEGDEEANPQNNQPVKNNQKQNAVDNPNEQELKARSFLKKLIKKSNNGSYQLALPLDKRASYANEIKNALKDLVEIYEIYTHGGIYDKPFCVVFRSEKFQKNIFKRWEKISSLMNAKDGRVLSEKELQLLSSVDLTKPPRIAMQDEITKLYNL